MILRVGLGCLLLWDGLIKIRHPYCFLSSVYDFELTGPRLGIFVAMVIPWLELFTGLCAVGGVFVGGAFLSAAFLIAMYAFANISASYRGLSVDRLGSVSGGAVSYVTAMWACLLLIFSVTGCILVIGIPTSTSARVAPEGHHY